MPKRPFVDPEENESENESKKKGKQTHVEVRKRKIDADTLSHPNKKLQKKDVPIEELIKNMKELWHSYKHQFFQTMQNIPNLDKETKDRMQSKLMKSEDGESIAKEADYILTLLERYDISKEDQKELFPVIFSEKNMNQENNLQILNNFVRAINNHLTDNESLITKENLEQIFKSGDKAGEKAIEIKQNAKTLGKNKNQI